MSTAAKLIFLCGKMAAGESTLARDLAERENAILLVQDQFLDSGVLAPRAWSWAALMHQAFGIDVLACAQCGGRLRRIATLHDPAVIRTILACLALAHSGQSPGPAPPESGAAAS